jgi:hypothetical protein
VSAIVLAMIALGAVAADPKPPELLKTVTYDITDFVSRARPDDQPDPTPTVLTPDMPIGSPSSPTRTQTRENFIPFVREIIDPRSWEPTGPGKIALDKDRLVVTQTAEIHRQIVRMFRQLRESPEEGKLLEAFKNAPRLARGTRFDRTEFDVAVKAIGKAANFPVEIDYDSLGKSNVEFDTPVTADVSGQTPAAALRGLVRTASQLEPPVVIGAARKSITLGIDTATDKDKMSRGFDIRRIPAGAANLDPSQPHPRKEIVDALIRRVEKDCNLKGLRESSGMLIASGTGKALAEMGRYLNELEDTPSRKADKP